MVSATKVTQRELLDIEKQYWEATRTNDFSTMRLLTANTFVLVQGEGVAKFNGDAFVDMLREGGFRLLSYYIDESDVTFVSLNDTTAFLAYRVEQEYQLGGDPRKGSSVHSSVWLKQGDRWHRTIHTISLT
jgi:hypothetical protein